MDGRLVGAIVMADPIRPEAAGLADSLRGAGIRHVALVSPIRPPARWRLLARRFRKQLIPIPLSRFSGQTVDRLRRFHVLNGHEVRSYAAKFIQEL